MDKKSSMSRIERQKREKVLRFSIRKYSFGAASVAVAALMFLGARVVSADSVTPVDQPHVEALTQDTSPLASQDKEEPTSSVKVDTAVASQLVTQLKDQLHVKETANTDLLVRAKEELVKAEQTLADSKVSQEEVDALVARLTNVLDQLRAVEVSQGKEDKNGESTQEATPEIKPEVVKPTSEISAKSEETSENTNAEQLEKAKASLKVSIDRLEQAIAQTPENDLTREILEKANAQVAVAKSAFGGVEVSLRDVEDMNRVIKRNESSVMIARNRLTSGSHDPRNGQSMGEGTQFRAYTATSSSGALKNVRYFASVDKRTNGGSNTKNDDPEFTEKKTVIKAKYEQNSSGKWMVYDVYFNNNGVAMAEKSYSQHYYFQPPFNIMDGSNTVENLTFTRYKNVDGNPNRKLSDGGSGFQKAGETAVISYPWAQKTKIFPGDRRATYDPQGVSRADQKWQVFKNNQNDPYLDKIVRKTDGNYTGGVSYTLGLEVGKEDLDYAIHMTARVKLKDNVTETEAANGNVYAASVTTGRTTNQSYIVGSQGTSLQTQPDAPKDPIKGLTVTKTVGDYAGDPINPVSSGYVKHGKDGTFPSGMSWSWAGDKSPSTSQAGVFKYTSIATYKDGSKSTDANSGSDGTVTLIVKPKKPAITTDVTNKKGLTGQQITVNVGSGVPNGSTVKLYDGDTVIGTGTTNGETATVTVTGALPGKPITAATVVNNGGTVTSDKSEPVTPTEAPDTQAPTLEISPAKQTVVEGQTVTFTVTARDDKHVNLNADDFTTKYGSRLVNSQASATNVKDTDTEKVRTITITTTAEDVGKTNTITFKATDNAGNKADPVTFTFNVTPRDTTPPKIYWLKDDGSRQELGYTHAAGQNVVIPLYRGDAVNTRLITIDDSGKVTDFRLENLQSGFSFTPVSGTATEESPLGQNVTGKVGLEVKKGKYTARAISTDGTNSTTGYFVFDIHEQAEKYPLEGKTETVTVGDSLKTWNGRVDSNQYTEAPKGRGVGVEWGWKGEAPKVVQDTAGVFKYTATATHPDKSVAESNPQVTIIVKPKAPTIETDLTGKAEVPNTEVVVNVHEGVKDGSIVTLYSPEGRAIGTGTVTNGKAKITGTIPVGNITAKTTVQTPGQPNVESELSPIKVATKIAETEKPSKIEITRKPNGDAIVTPKKPDGSTYPPKTTVEIPGENGTPIKVTIGDNGSGEVPNDNLPKTDVPGTGTVTEPNKKPSQPVDVTTPARKTPKVELEQDPKTGDVTVTPKKPDGSTYPPGTKVEIPGKDGKPITVTIGEDGKGKVPNSDLPEGKVSGPGKITEPNKPAVEVPKVETPAKVTPETPVTEKPGKIEITQQPNGNAIVTPKKPDGSTYPPKTTVEIPGENGTPIKVTIGDNGSGEVPNDNLPKTDVPGTGTVTEPNKKPSQPVDVTTPARKTPKVELEQDPKTGDVTVTPKKPDGSTYPPGTKVEIPGKDGKPITVTIGEDGKGKVPNSDLPEGKVSGPGKITEPNKPAVEVPKVETPAKVTPETPVTEKPGKIEITQQPNGNAIVTPKKPDGSTYPPKTTVEIPGENGTPIKVTIGDNGSGEVPNDNLPKNEVPGTGTVTEPNKKPSQPVDVTTPARKTPKVELEQDPKTGDVTVTPKKPDGSTYPPGTKVEIPGKDGKPITVTIGEDGKGKVPNSDLPEGKVSGPGKITEPNKPAVEVPKVETPAKVTPETPVTEKPGKIEITQQPNGNAIVTPKKPDGSTYPPKTTVEIPGENGTPITVTIGDNGSGEVPNDNLPKTDVPGTGTVTEPNKKPSQPVDVTTPARKTPKVELEQDPKTGDVTVTPKKPDGSTYPPGTKVEIPGKDGKPITVTIGEDGKGKVPNSDLPEGKVSGPGKITEPNKPAVEVPKVETPAKVTPETPVTEKPGKIEITQQPNGNAIVTPKKPDGSTYPPKTTVEIPGENGTPIKVTIGDNGSGEVPNDNLPKTDVPGTGTVTEPNKKPSQPVDVTTPARKTPKVELEQDPKTGDVTVTPKKPDGSTYPPGTKVEIPGKDGKPITVTIGEDGKGKVPNSDLPEGKVSGPGKITEPNKPAVEVPKVETPAKVTPATPTTETPSEIEITRKPNGDAIVTPKQPDGSTYPPGTKVEIPSKDKDGNPTTITVTIGDNGSGEVPNDNLPKNEVPGTGTVTEPNKKPSQPVDVTTPAQKTPTVDVEQDPKTGDVTVTPKQPDGSTYPPGTKVEIPGKDGNPITVTIGEDGKGKVPNSDLPEGKVSGPGKITEPNKPAVEVPKVETPGKVTPNTPTTETPSEIEITRKPNGDAIVTPKKPNGKPYLPGTTVEIPSKDKDGNPTTITVTIGDNGSGEVPNDNLPKKDVPGTGTVTEPNKKPSQPVNVTTPAQKTPTLDVEQDPKTGDVTVTPKKPDGSTYPPGTKVEIPGKDGKPITVTIGEDGKGKVPNSDLPEGKVSGPGKITEPNKPAVEVPKVETPAKVTPATPTTETPSEIEITRKPNGDAIVTPKQPDGSTYPPGTKVEIPSKDKDGNPTTITVTIGDNGSGEVPNDNLPKNEVPGTGTVTEPNKKPSQPVDVTTPAQKTPTVDVEQDPKTGDVTVTPKQPDGSTYPPGTKVEIPGKDGNPITVTIGEDGKGKVPNSDLPEGKVSGPGKITEPNKPAVEVPKVETPGKVTPNTPTTETPSEIEITRKPNGDAIVTPKKPNGKPYLPGTTVEIPSKDKDGNPTTITVTIGDNGSGEVPNDNLPKKDVPGTGTVTEPNKKPSQPVNVTTPAQKTPTLDVEQDPKTGDVTVTPKKPDGSTFPPGTTVEIPGKDGKPIPVTIGEDGKGKVPNSELPDGKVPGTGKITEPGKPAVEVPVTTPGKVTPNTPTTETPSEIEITRKPNGDAIVTPKKPDGSTYPSGSKVVIPGENNTPIEVTIGDNGSGEVPNDNLPKKDVPGTGTVTEPNKKPSQPVDVTTPARKTPTLELDQDPKTGDVTVTPKKPDGKPYPPGTTVEIPGKDGNPITVTIGEDGKGKVPNSELPDGKVPGTGKITEPGKPAVEVPVTTPGKVTPNTPTTETPSEIEITRKPNGDAIVTPKKPNGKPYPPGTTVEIPGENGTPITVTIGDNGSGEVPNDNLPKTDVPGKGKVTEPNKKPSQPVDVTTPARKTPTVDVEQDPKTGDVTVTPKKPDGKPYPPGTKVEIPGEDGPIIVEIGQDGKGKVPNDKLPKKDVPGTGKITEPGKPAVEVPVETPAKVTPNAPRTEKPGKIEITQQPNGNAIVTPKKPDGSTYPPGTTVEIPGENGTPITVTIGDNGSGEVPNDNLPKKDVPGTGTVTEPNKKPSQPVDVTTPAQKTPTLDVEQDPKTGEVTVTPKKPDGSTYPPGTTVEIPGEDGPITVEIGQDGKGKVPNDKLPKKDVPGTGKITEPGKPAVEVPVTTPAKVTPNTPTTETPSEIEITRKPNGDAVVTPKKPDGSTYPSGSKVVIPGENGTPITVTIGDNGSGEVPNDKLPKKDVPGTGTVTEPNKKPSQPVDVTTPARKTPTVDVEQDPKTGDVTVTPKKPDGSTYPPGTTVEIPGKDGNPITVTIGEDGKGKVPNSELPDGKVPGTGKITEPGKPAVEVPVETPAKVTPNTPTTETPSEIEITRKPNGDAIVTPKKPDGSTYPSGSKVVIPGENNTPIEVTIGDNGSGEVPNDKLPKKDVPGTGTVTEPNKKPSQPVDMTTPARKTPTVDVEQDPKTGDVTVTPKKPDGSTYPPGTKVEIPGKDGNPITVTIGEDGKGKVPNSELPDGKVPGTGKITEPGKPAVEVPVTTPGKVTPNTPTTETPVAPVTPDTNGAKSNDSQKVLPNTGTESNATLASLGLLGILGGLGLALGKKKED